MLAWLPCTQPQLQWPLVLLRRLECEQFQMMMEDAVALDPAQLHSLHPVRRAQACHLVESAACSAPLHVAKAMSIPLISINAGKSVKTGSSFKRSGSSHAHATEISQVHLYLADQGNAFFLFEAIGLSNACDQHQDVLLGVLWMCQCPALELVTPGNVVRLQQAVAGGWLVMQVTNQPCSICCAYNLSGSRHQQCWAPISVYQAIPDDLPAGCIVQACFWSPGPTKWQYPHA